MFSLGPSQIQNLTLITVHSLPKYTPSVNASVPQRSKSLHKSVHVCIAPQSPLLSPCHSTCSQSPVAWTTIGEEEWPITNYPLGHQGTILPKEPVIVFILEAASGWESHNHCPHIFRILYHIFSSHDRLFSPFSRRP